MNLEYKDSYMELGYNIAYYRRKASLSQDELAEKIGAASGNHISRYETAKMAPSLDKIFAIAKILEIPPNKLFEFRE